MPGVVVEGAELVALLPLLAASARLAAYGRTVRPAAEEIGERLAALPALRPLRDLLRRSLDDDGGVTDEASPALRRVRVRVRELRREIVKRLEAFFQGAEADALFQDRYVTVRHGRYVLPVLAAARGRLRGIVHDRSQSGATLFVEPERMVETNNELVQAVREEEAEVLRVLAALTAAVAESLPELDALVAELGALDLVFARAELAGRMDAVEPAVVETPREVELVAARHPLLLAQSWREPGAAVMPIDLRLGSDKPLLVITGPNAGGKTIALKTLGLLALMAQAGCHVPAAPGARLPRFARVCSIIGDEQSVQENLSTFSAFIRHLRDVLDAVDDRSLVLLDELGAGTDPDDGAALAQAVLDELARRGALCAASTHLEPLKAFAASHPAARNASVEFDTERLAPTFRLVYDRPGQSYALAIAARHGLDPALIERAHSYRSQQGRALAELLARIEARDREQAERTLSSERAAAESAALLARAAREREAARREAEERLQRARAEAQRLLADVKRAVNEEWDRLRNAERSRPALEQSRARLRDLGARVVEATRDADGAAEPDAAAGADPALAAATPRAGDTVHVPDLGLRGELLAVDGATASVRAGTLTVRVPAAALRVLARASEGGARPARGRAIDVPVKGGVPGELHLIGRTRDEASDALEKYLDDAFLAGLGQVRIVHGKGTGALRRAVHELLAAHPLVAEHRAGAPHEGGDGATVATLRDA